MSNAGIPDEPPDDNEAYANLDESLDDEDSLHPGSGPEGERSLDSGLVVDEAELEEAGAQLDDPERMSMLDGGMDDPDGAGPPPAADDEAGWDVDPVTHPATQPGAGRDVGADGDAVTETDLVDVPDLEDDGTVAFPDLDLDEVPADAPGLDGGR
jgi:hypothetical protein